EQLAYWRRQLHELPALQLPTDHPRPHSFSYEGLGHNVSFNPATAAQLKALSEQSGGTLYMTLLAAFAALLGRYSGQEEVVIGAPIANRNRAELEPLIGLFVNTLVLRIDLRGEPTFRELLQRVRDVTLEAYAHQDVPFEKLVEELRPDRDMSRNPLVQVIFQLQNMGWPLLRMGELVVAPGDLRHTATRFDLEVHFREEPELSALN